MEVFGFNGSVSSENEVKERFRKLVKKTHPDRFHSFTEQTMAAEEFIRIKEAYDVLLNQIRRKGSIAFEQPHQPNPQRGSFSVPNWPLVLELEKALSFIYWIRAKIPAPVSVHIPAVLKSLGNPGFSFRINSVINLLLLALVTCLFAVLFVLAFLMSVVILCSFALFIPAFLFYQISTKALYTLFAKYHGFKPSAYCGNKKGEIAYLFIRTIPVIVINIAYFLVLISSSNHIPLRLFCPLSTGLVLWLGMLNLSVCYEWICRFRLSQIKREK